MQKFLPFLQWLPDYSWALFKKDLIAGFTVGIVLVPQAMAYAMIAGLPPVYGLYAALFPLLVYTFLGTSRQLAIGPVAMDSLLVAAGLGTLAITGIENYIAMAIFLAFMVGAIQLLLGFFRMGFLVNFLSRPVISGFTSGAVIIIILSQFKHLLGVDMANSSKVQHLATNVMENIGVTNSYDLLLGFLGMVLIVVFKRWKKRFPAVLLAVIAGIFAVYLLDLEIHGVQLVGIIPEGLPNFQIPDINLKDALKLGPIALTIALVGYLETISIGKALEEKNNRETIDANQELIALGSSNIVGSLFQAYPVTASFSRSAINGDMGARTNLSGLVSMLLVLLTLLFLTPLFYYLPKAILAAIIMVSVFRLIDLAYPKILWKYRKDEFAILLVTFLATLFVGIPEGILTGVLLSLLLMVYKSSKPHFVILGRIKGSDYYRNIDRFESEIELRHDLLIVRFDAQLYFGNKNFFKRRLYKFVNDKGAELRAVILNAEAINYIDSTAVQMLVQVIGELRGRGLQFFIAGATGPTRDTIFSSGIIEVLNKEFLFARTKEAVDSFDKVKNPTELEERVAYQNLNKGDQGHKSSN